MHNGLYADSYHLNNLIHNFNRSDSNEQCKVSRQLGNVSNETANNRSNMVGHRCFIILHYHYSLLTSYLLIFVQSRPTHPHKCRRIARQWISIEFGVVLDHLYLNFLSSMVPKFY